MIYQRWRLSEYGEDNLGLACTGQGLVLGRTLLIERRHGRFIVRDPSEIEYLLSRAYRRALPLQRLVAGLANVAKALNANDLCLAHIAAVHLRIPALPDQAARQELEAADILIKSADWNPALHPRAGTPPNPGWFCYLADLVDDSSLCCGHAAFGNNQLDRPTSYLTRLNIQITPVGTIEILYVFNVLEQSIR